MRSSIALMILPQWSRAYLRRLRHLFWRAVFRPRPVGDLVLMGSEYGGWWVPQQELSRTHTVLSFGIGADASFDLSLIDNCPCIVHAFDPTPLSCAWVEQEDWPWQFVFHPIAISGRDGTLKLQEPVIDGNVSFFKHKNEISSIENTITVPTSSINSIINNLGLKRIDICKIDIEGSEYEVVCDIQRWAIIPKILLIEFHHGRGGYSFKDTLEAIRCIKKMGYRNYYVSRSGREFGFQLEECMTAR